MPTDDNCRSGTLVSICPANATPPGANYYSSALPSSSSVAPSSSSVCTANNNTSTHYCSEGAMKEYIFLTDSRDNQTYKAVVIGTQTWMAENLNYATLGSKCGYTSGNGTSLLSDNNTTFCDTYGRLYDWNTAMNNSASSTAVPSGVRGVCPSGWHLPSQAEWNVMTVYIGGANTEGKRLKATSGWNKYNGVSGNGTDEYGFSALPGGSGGGNNGYWWSSASEHGNDYGYNRNMYYDEGARLGSNYKSNLFSVRCLQD